MSHKNEKLSRRKTWIQFDLVKDKVVFYTDAACTENYDPYADTDSDLTIYVKWTE